MLPPSSEALILGRGSSLFMCLMLMPDVDTQPLEQLNFAHISVEQGEVTSRDIKHEFNVWADSMHINWRFFAKVISPTVFRTRFPNAMNWHILANSS
jgi:hypothetical protein